MRHTLQNEARLHLPFHHTQVGDVVSFSTQLTLSEWCMTNVHKSSGTKAGANATPAAVACLKVANPSMGIEQVPQHVKRPCLHPAALEVEGMPTQMLDKDAKAESKTQDP